MNHQGILIVVEGKITSEIVSIIQGNYLPYFETYRIKSVPKIDVENFPELFSLCREEGYDFVTFGRGEAWMTKEDVQQAMSFLATNPNSDMSVNGEYTFEKSIWRSVALVSLTTGMILETVEQTDEKVALITPTRNRAKAFDLTQKWMGRQTHRNFEWVVVNDGNEEYDYSDYRQKIIKRTPKDGEGHSLCENLKVGLKHTDADYILVVEDDDWYSSNYIEIMLKKLKEYDLVGNSPAIYYHLSRKLYRNIKNFEHSSLAQTGFKGKLKPFVISIAEQGRPMIDLALWRSFSGNKTILQNEGLHVSVKGLPGESGIGMGHRLKQGIADPEGTLLKGLIGEDYLLYEEILQNDT